MYPPFLAARVRLPSGPMFPPLFNWLGPPDCPLLPAYLSPRFTKIDPDGFTTRTISAVAAHNASRNSCGVDSEPICPS